MSCILIGVLQGGLQNKSTVSYPADFGSLDFYDVFDRFYPILNKQPNPYVINGGAGTEPVYEIPERLFETFFP